MTSHYWKMVGNVRDRRQKFVKLAEARVTRAMRDIRLIGNLSNRSAYSYTEDDVRKIFRTLQKEIEAARGKFGGEGDVSKQGFKLDT
jgi:hypothetical protein